MACTASWVLVADGNGGLSTINVSNPANAFVKRRVALDNAGVVTVLGNTAYVDDSNDLVRIDLCTGNVLSRLSLNSPVQDRSLNHEPLQVMHSTDSPGDAGIHQLRVFAGGALLYTTQLARYNTFSLANPAPPTLIVASQRLNKMLNPLSTNRDF